MAMESSADIQQSLALDNRERLAVTGVGNVDSFSDSEIILTTCMGRLTVKGEGLQINRLDVDTGDLSVDGRVSSLEYSKNKSDKKRTLAERLFR